jgi:hypothetical protein
MKNTDYIILLRIIRVIESKKYSDGALWLTFESDNDPDTPYIIMFKYGDDVQQDQFIMRVLSVISDLWLKEGLDLCMSLYGCISTGLKQGNVFFNL